MPNILMDCAKRHRYIIGAIWATYDSIGNGQKYSVFFLPLLHAFAIWNVLEQLNQPDGVQDTLVGTVLMITGIVMTLIASKTEIAWNWNVFEWDDEIEYYGWIDRIGQLGIAYFLTGITWAIGDANLDQMLWVIWAAFLSGIAIQGFRDETETPWRRGIGSMGSIFSLFMLSLHSTQPYTYVTWMFLGVVALGFGFAYISRMGEVSTLFSETNIGVEDGIIEDSGKGGLNEILPIPKPVTSSEDMEDEDSEEALEVEDGIEDDDFDFSELDEEDEEILDMSGALEMKKEVEEKISEKKEEIRT